MIEINTPANRFSSLVLADFRQRRARLVVTTIKLRNKQQSDHSKIRGHSQKNIVSMEQIPTVSWSNR